MLTPWKKSYDQPRQHIKKQRHYFANKSPSSQGCAFSSSHGWMWELDSKDSWALKNWCFWTVVLEKTLESLLDWRRSNQSILKEISPEYSLEGLMLKLKLQHFWPPDEKKWLIWKYPDAGKDWRQEEKGMTEDEMVGWHHWLDGHGFGWTPGAGGGQGGLASQRLGRDWAAELNWIDDTSELWTLMLLSLVSLILKTSSNSVTHLLQFLFEHFVWKTYFYRVVFFCFFFPFKENNTIPGFKHFMCPLLFK